jgi:hypothetical protein
MGLGPTRWMLPLPSACCLIPMRDLASLRLGKFFFLHANHHSLVSSGGCISNFDESFQVNSDAPTRVLPSFSSALTPYSQRLFWERHDHFLTPFASTRSYPTTPEYYPIVQNQANGRYDAQGPASSISTYHLPSAPSLLGRHPVTHLSSSPPVGFYNYLGGSPIGDECGLLDTQSHTGYYYNAVAGQRQPLANVSTAHCHDSSINNYTACTCNVPNQTQFQDPQTLLTGFNICSNHDTVFGESVHVGHAIQPYEHIPGPDVNGEHTSGSHTLFEESPATQSMQAPPAIATQAPVPIQCTALGCSATFKREPDRLRHEAAVHGINQLLQLYLCPVNGCSKSQGGGYTRKDKLTEHLWKKHGNLGHAKRV